MVKHTENLQLSVFIPLVLENFLDRYSFPCLCDCGLENDAERAVANNLLSVVSETLLFLLVGV